MAGINYSVNESVSGSIQNMPKVYFCCHPDDFDEFFQKTKDEFHKIYPKISFWYYDKSDEPKQDEIDQMNLIIVIVTNKFLDEYHRGKHSCYKVIKMAMEGYIPQLPLLQEGVAEASYASVFGHSQYLSKSNNGKFAISYDEKLKKKLDETLFLDEERKRIKDAFVAIAFLSYRKKDRKYVKQIMELIHSDEKYRDVGIWYDEFLTPGEEFDKEIEEVLINSDLFVLMVTANLLEKDNYVIESEYPKAVESNLPILSIECAKTDKAVLGDIFQTITDVYSVNEAARISQELEKIFTDKNINMNVDDAYHIYLMGNAYLSGIYVEKNSARGIALLSKSAEMGCNEAYERLAITYHNGAGVTEDPEKEIIWRRKYVEKLKTELSDEQSKVKLFMEIKKLAECIFGRVRFDEAKKVYKEAIDLFNQIEFASLEEKESCEYQIYSELGDSIRLKAADTKKVLSDEEIEEAKECYLHALKLCENDIWRQAMQYSNLGGLFYQIAEFILLDVRGEKEKGYNLLEEAENYCEQSLKHFECVKQEIPLYDYLTGKSIVCDKMAGIYRLRENYEETLKYFSISVEIWDKFQKDYPSHYHEEGYVLALYNYAETRYNLGNKDVEKELIAVAKLIGDMKDKNGTMTLVGILTGYKVNGILSNIYETTRDNKKYRYYTNAMKKYEKWLGMIAR